MRIFWDEEKDKKLIVERGISLDEIADLILNQRYCAILKNPAREGQKLFILTYRDYTYAVPFVIDANKNIILKTVFPSRKYHKIYGGKKDENKA
jgi:uncharacterized DUF497 family protein